MYQIKATFSFDLVSVPSQSRAESVITATFVWDGLRLTLVIDDILPGDPSI